MISMHELVIKNFVNEIVRDYNIVGGVWPIFFFFLKWAFNKIGFVFEVKEKRILLLTCDALYYKLDKPNQKPY